MILRSLLAPLIDRNRAAPVARPRPNPFHAVTIQGNCEAARPLDGRRFLSKDAPSLPLAGCAAPGGCTCVYRHHPDRRAGNPRRGSVSAFDVRTERRHSKGRRLTED
jgi:hypothetical protein